MPRGTVDGRPDERDFEFERTWQAYRTRDQERQIAVQQEEQRIRAEEAAQRRERSAPRSWRDIVTEANERRVAAGAPLIAPEDTGEIIRELRGEDMPTRTGVGRAGTNPVPVPPPHVTAKKKAVVDARALNIEAILRRSTLKNFVYRVGIELEGGWTKLPEGVDLHPDGSVCGINLTRAEQQANMAATSPSQQVKLRLGELQSVPMDPREAKNWMEQSYPTHVNDTCGLHVHMSFKSALHYMWLMVPEYQATMKEYVRRWAIDEGLASGHRLFSRLQGANTYCKDEFFADAQAARTKKSYDHGGPSRYTMINYPHGLHGTIEARLLPMFDTVDQSVKAVQRVLDVTNACIIRCAQREEKLDASAGITKAELHAMVEESEEVV